MNLESIIGTHQISIVLCFFLGALHALEPGHGKTALAAHLLSERGLKKPALAAFSTALSHSISILLIALVVHGTLDLTLTGDQGLTFQHWLNVASGLTFIAVGGWLLWTSRKKGHKHGPSCGCGAHAKSHAPLTQVVQEKSSINTLLLGFAVGLVPCPTALVALSQAILSHNWMTAIVVVLTFSTGIFCGLFAVGSLLGLQVAPRIMAWSQRAGSRVNYRAIQAVVIFVTGAWHLLL